MLKSTAKNKRYWKERKIDWVKEYVATANHPHRDLILNKLKLMPFGSLLEVGCASGPNLIRIQHAYPNVQIGGIDLNKDAIKVAQQILPSGLFVVDSVDGMFFSDKSTDVILSDMSLIYIGPAKIKTALKEIKRVARKFVVLCEFYNSSFLKRMALRFAGYNAYNYPKLLEELGFYDIEMTKIKESEWPGGQPQKDYGYVFTARV